MLPISTSAFYIEKIMKCICPECKNQIDIAKYPNLKVSYVIECNTCGMTLEVTAIENDEVKTEIVDEGK